MFSNLSGVIRQYLLAVACCHHTTGTKGAQINPHVLLSTLTANYLSHTYLAKLQKE